MGLFVGTGDQDNYAKIVVSGTAGGRIVFFTEIGGRGEPESSAPLALPGPNFIDLYLRVDPDRGDRPAVLLGHVRRGHRPADHAGASTACSRELVHELHVGTGGRNHLDLAGGAPVFPATWDFIRALPATTAPTLGVTPSTLGFGTVTTGQTQSLALQLTGAGNAETADLVLGSPALERRESQPIHS